MLHYNPLHFFKNYLKCSHVNNTFDITFMLTTFPSVATQTRYISNLSPVRMAQADWNSVNVSWSSCIHTSNLSYHCPILRCYQLLSGLWLPPCAPLWGSTSTPVQSICYLRITFVAVSSLLCTQISRASDNYHRLNPFPCPNPPFFVFVLSDSCFIVDARSNVDLDGIWAHCYRCPNN